MPPPRSPNVLSLNSPLYKAVAVGGVFVVNVFALYLLLRGHNLPGGGFIAGLVTAISMIMLSLAIGLEEIHRVLRFEPVRLAAAGLVLAVMTGVLPMLFNRPFLEQFNIYIGVPMVGEVALGTPLLFDAGVYLLVVGVTTKVVFVLATSTQGFRALVKEEEARFSSPLEQPIEEEESMDTGWRVGKGGEDAT
jgi:multicomponent Na+:H+ antiporter subunit B